MPRYRVLRDFGSHLGNHYRGEHLTLPDGPLPRGFAGFVERVVDPSTKDVTPASGRANDVPPEAGSVPPASSPAGQPEPDEQSPPATQVQAGYSDKMIRNRRSSR